MTKYWFRKRRGLLSPDLGWGWVPISKEGWFVVIAFILFIIINQFIIIYFVKDETNLAITMITMVVSSIVIVSIICHNKTDNSSGGKNEAH